MDECLVNRWEKLGTKAIPPFSLLARKIACSPNDSASSFQLLWMMVDFACLCIKYSTVLLMSLSAQNPKLFTVLQPIFTSFHLPSVKVATCLVQLVKKPLS